MSLLKSVSLIFSLIFEKNGHLYNMCNVLLQGQEQIVCDLLAVVSLLWTQK